MAVKIADLQKSALMYLDQYGLIDNIRERCTFYKDVQDKAFQFSLTIEPQDLLELDVILGNLMLKQPTGAAKIFQEVVFMVISTLKLLPRCTEVSQVVVSFRIMSLPRIPEFHLSSTGDFLKLAGTRRFIQYEGIVCSLSTLHKYTKVARYECDNAACQEIKGDKYIRLHIPGASEAQTIRSDFKCSECGGLLREDVSCRLLADKLVVELMDEVALDGEQSGRRHQSLTTYLRDEMIRGIEIGQKLCVIGLPVLDVPNSILALEANNITQSSIQKTPEQQTLPESLQQLHNDRKASPWSFGLSLAYAFAGGIAPAGTYLHLKLGLLLSLLGSMTQEGGRLDLLAVGTDSVVIQRLLSYAGRFAERCITHTSSSDLTASVSRDRKCSGSCFIDGGSMLLANSGVCIINDLGSQRKQLKYALLQALENNKIFVDIPAKLNERGSQQLFLPRRCQVWATLDPSSQRKNQQLDDVQVDLDKKDISQALADVFGQVYFAENKTDCYADYMQIHQTLQQAMGMNTVSLVPDEDFSQFLCYARSQPVEFTEASERFLQGYYVASRRVRATGIHMWTLPITAIKTLTSLAEAHARLNLRQEVTEYDAVMAVLLYEECVTTRSGQSVLGVKPLVHIKDNNIQHYIGQERDEYLFQFHQQVKHFINTHATDVEE